MKRLKLIGFLCGILLLTAFSCNKEDKPRACGVENPHQNVEWLSTFLSQYSNYEVYLYQYEGTEYIGVHLNSQDNGDTFLIQIFNCDGTIFCNWGGVVGSGSCQGSFLLDAKKTLLHKN